ncbi:hypothetical protein BGZ74_000745 [Mortierella antarctica]|nr:hypothetical protein BGZ74_000745 [Mortierella antarctica]KAG0348639.1 hypothetical protein BG005_011395 [Podila minutissima]
MDIKIVSSITRLANYMPLGSYVVYTALETYSFSLGATPAPVKTIIQTPNFNYTCFYDPGTAFTYTTCTSDQSSALKVSLAIGFFLAMFLSFLKQVPKNGTPPLAIPDEDDLPPTPDEIAKENRLIAEGLRRPRHPKYRAGIVFHVWGHAALSVVAFGTLSLFSASVSQCLFPHVRPWNFVFTQVILLVICCFIAMFWIDDPSLSIGLMVVPPTDTHPQPDPRMGIMPVSAMVVSVSSSANAVGATGTGTGTGTGGSSGGGPVSRMGAISRKIINKASASFGRRSKNPTRPESSDEIEGDSDSAEDTGYQTKGDKEELDPESSNSANAGVGATIARPQEVARSQRDLRRQDDSDLPGHIAVKME